MRKFLLATVILGATFISTAQQSQAAFRLVLQSGASTQIIDDGDFLDNSASTSTIQIDNLPFAGYDVSVTARTNSPGAIIPGMGLAGRVTDQTVTVRSVNATNDLVITVYSDGFLLGTGGGTLTNSISGTALDPATSPIVTSASSNSWINGDFTLPGITVPNATATGNVSITGGTAPYAQSSSNFKLVNLTQPVAITNQLTIANLPTAGTANVTATATLSAVPAPAGLVLAITAIPGFGLGFCIRRRKNG